MFKRPPSLPRCVLAWLSRPPSLALPMGSPAPLVNGWRNKIYNMRTTSPAADSKAKQSKAKQSKAKQGNAKQSNAMQCKAKQRKAKQNNHQ